MSKRAASPSSASSVSSIRRGRKRLIPIAECKAAGHDVEMITGDNLRPRPRSRVSWGLGKGTVDTLTGHAIDAMDDEALRRALPPTWCSPHQPGA